MALITAAQARAYIPALTGTAEDSALDVIIVRVGETFARHLGYPEATAGGTPTLESTAYVRYYDPRRALDVDGALHLGIWPVTALTSLYDDPDESYGSSTEVTTDDARLVGATGLIRLKPLGSHAWSMRGARAIKASITAGYTTVPPGIQHAAGLCVAAWWARRNIPLEPGTEAHLPPAVAAVLRPYRLAASFGAGYQGEA